MALIGRLVSPAGTLRGGRHYAVTFWARHNLAGDALVAQIETTEGSGDMGWTVFGGADALRADASRGGFQHTFIATLEFDRSSQSLRARVAGAAMRAAQEGINLATVEIREVDEVELNRRTSVFAPILDLVDVGRDTARAAGRAANSAADSGGAALNLFAELGTSLKWIAIGVPIAAAVITGAVLYYGHKGAT